MTSSLPLPSRRQFLHHTGLGCGSLALASLLHHESLHGAARQTHFPAKVRSVIWLFMTGGPSQVDTFDYKPELQKRDGQTLAGADPKTGFFTTSGKCLKSPFAWQQHGQSGSWVSELLPHMAQHVDDMAFMHSCYSTANNHAPASIEISAGMVRPGYPSMGAWVTYGLGSLNDNLPAFVVMHDTKPRGDDGIWSPGFLPKNYQPLLLDARRREEIANLAPHPGHDRRPAAGPARPAAPAQPGASAAARPGGGPGRPHSVLRAGLPHADRRAGGARPAQETEATSRSSTAWTARIAATVRPAVPAGPPAGRARRALRADLRLDQPHLRRRGRRRALGRPQRHRRQPSRLRRRAPTSRSARC